MKKNNEMMITIIHNNKCIKTMFLRSLGRVSICHRDGGEIFGRVDSRQHSLQYPFLFHSVLGTQESRHHSRHEGFVWRLRKRCCGVLDHRIDALFRRRRRNSHATTEDHHLLPRSHPQEGEEQERRFCWKSARCVQEGVK